MIGVLGWLSPEGKFYECPYWGHSSLAKTICDKVYKNIPTGYFGATDYLLDRNWLVIYSREMGKIHFNRETRTYDDRGFADYRGDVLYLTDEQKKWVDDNADKLNSMQIESYEKILKFERAYFNAGG